MISGVRELYWATFDLAVPLLLSRRYTYFLYWIAVNNIGETKPLRTLNYLLRCLRWSWTLSLLFVTACWIKPFLFFASFLQHFCSSIQMILCFYLQQRYHRFQRRLLWVYTAVLSTKWLLNGNKECEEVSKIIAKYLAEWGVKHWQHS